MPVYRNPDFLRLPSGLACLFDTVAENSFFTLPAWYDLMARHGVPAVSEIRVYTDERPRSAMALLLCSKGLVAGRCLTSLANAYSVEHAIISGSGTDLDAGFAAILSEILSERPRWDGLGMAELDPLDPSYRTAVRSLRRAGLLVECVFASGTWYEETAALSFADYVAARPSELRNTWRRKRRRVDRSNCLSRAFFADAARIDQAIADYQTIYAASWKPAEAFPEFTLGRGDDHFKKLWLPKRRERWGINAANPRTWSGLGFGLKREAGKFYHRLRNERVSPFR